MFKNDREAYVFLGGIVENLFVTRQESFQLKALFQKIDYLMSDPAATVSQVDANQAVTILQGLDALVAATPLQIRQHESASMAIQFFANLLTSRMKMEEAPVDAKDPQSAQEEEGPTFEETEETSAILKMHEENKKRTKPSKTEYTQPRLTPIED